MTTRTRKLLPLIGLGTLCVVSLAVYGRLFAIAGGLDQGTPTHLERLAPASAQLIQPAFVLPANVELTPELKARRHAEAAPLWISGISVLYVVYAASLLVARIVESRIGLAVCLIAGVLFSAFAVAAPHMLSTDVYAYVFYGRIFGVYHGNPYLDVPAQYPGDSYHEHIFWKYAPSFYGPLWTLISGPLARLADEDVALASALFRSTTAIAVFFTAALVAVILRAIQPAQAALGVVAFAWNPLVVIEAGLGGHNDALVGLFVALSFACLVWRLPTLASGALVLGGLVKLITLALVPLFGLYALRTARTAWAGAAYVLGSLALGISLVFLVLNAVRAGPETLAVTVLGADAVRYTNGLGELALGELRVLFGETREDTEVPLQFKGWWVANHVAAPLRASRGDTAEVVRTLPQFTGLLVVGPQYGRWMRVYDPDRRVIGFVRTNALGPLDTRPSQYDDDADILAREQGPSGSEALQKSNLVVRGVGWLAFGIVWLGALIFGTGSITGLARGSVAAFLALFYLASGWFWPWYLLWALAPAAIVPGSWLSVWMFALSWGSLLLYAGLGFGETSQWYLHTYRSLAMFGLPLAFMVVALTLAALTWIVARVWSTLRGTRPSDAASPMPAALPRTN